jgi:hypothetical protein
MSGLKKLMTEYDDVSISNISELKSKYSLTDLSAKL